LGKIPDPNYNTPTMCIALHYISQELSMDLISAFLAEIRTPDSQFMLEARQSDDPESCEAARTLWALSKKKNTIFLTPLYVTCCDAEKTMISSAERRRLYLKSAKTQNRETWERTGT
jgi:hypothetical protein